jgi:glycosyltransferase involved in cell wall biosynthesis
MRALHVMASGERGGGADHLAALLPELVALGVSCSAVVSPEGPLARRLESLGIPVERLEMMRSRINLGAVRGLGAVIRRELPTVVHCHGTRAAFFVALARPSLPLIYTVHGLAYRQEVGPVRAGVMFAAEAVACRSATQVLSVAAADLVDLKRRHFLGRDRGIHIPNAVDLVKFAPGDRRQARADLDLPIDGTLVGTVSRLVPQKALGDLIDAVLAIDELSLVIVGDGPERAALGARARRGKGRVLFLGARDDVPQILRSLDIFALSSRWEGEPIALLEALATGLPCVVTRTTGAVEVLEGSAAGRLVEIGRPEALSAALMDVARNAPVRQAMGQAARRTVANRSWPKVAAQVVEVYRAVVNGGF